MVRSGRQDAKAREDAPVSRAAQAVGRIVADLTPSQGLYYHTSGSDSR